MDTIAFAGYLLCFVWSCRGLELMMDLNPPAVPGALPLCGILQCVESYKSTNDTTPSEQQVMEDSVPPSILGMDIYRRTRLFGKDSEDPGELVATLSPDQPRLSQDLNGAVIKGLLTNVKATLRLELMRETDCKAEYTCLVRVSDHQGKQQEKTAQVLQPSHRRDQWQSDCGSLTSAVTLQILLMLQRLEAKVETLNGSIKSLEKRTEKASEASENKMEEGLAGLESRMNLQEIRISDKMCEIEKSVSELSNSTALSERTASRQIMERFDNAVLYNISILTTAVEDVRTRLDSCHHDNGLLFLNLTEAMRTVCAADEVFSDRQEDNLVLSKNCTKDDSQRQNGRTSKTRADGNTGVPEDGAFPEAQKTITSDPKGVTDSNVPTSCERGMTLFSPPDGSFPYPVVQVSGQTGITFPVLCDTVTAEGGWIVIQRRTSGHVDFYRPWADYKAGFGFFSDDFWLGNDKIHALTNNEPYELRVEMAKLDGSVAYATYDRFHIADEKAQYRLTLGKYSGTAGNAMRFDNEEGFSTVDRDNDSSSKMDCAEMRTGAWWYSACSTCNLNGKWGSTGRTGIYWAGFTDGESASFSEMKIRQKND